MAKIEQFDNLLVASSNARLRLALGAEQFSYEKHRIMLHNTRTSSNLWNAPFQLAIDDSSIFVPLYYPQHFDFSALTSAAVVRGMQAVIRLAYDLVDHPPPLLALATAVDSIREQSGWNVVGYFLSEELGERSSTSHRAKTPFNLGAWQRTGVNLYLLHKKMKRDKQQPKQKNKQQPKQKNKQQPEQKNEQQPEQKNEQQPKQKRLSTMLIAQARLAEIAERLDKIMGPVISGDQYNQLVDQAAAAAIEMRRTVAVDSLALLSESDEGPVALNEAPNPCRSVAKPILDKDLPILQKNPEYIIGLELHLLMQH